MRRGHGHTRGHQALPKLSHAPQRHAFRGSSGGFAARDDADKAKGEQADQQDERGDRSRVCKPERLKAFIEQYRGDHRMVRQDDDRAKLAQTSSPHEQYPGEDATPGKR